MHLVLHAGDGTCPVTAFEDVVDEFDDGDDVIFLQSAGGDGGGADANAGGEERRGGIERDHVFVDGNVGSAEV